MESLISLVELISKQKVNQINIVTEDTTTNLGKLYHGLASGEIKSEIEIYNVIYAGDLTKKKSVSKLKTELLKRLINTLFFIDIQNYGRSNYEIALHEVNKATFAVTILLDRLVRKEGIALAEKTLKKAIKFDLIENVVFLASKIAKHYTIYVYDDKKSSKYFKLLEKYKKFYDQELVADQVFSQLGRGIFGKKESNYDSFKEKLEELEKYQKVNKTYNFNYKVYNAFYFYYLYAKDFVKLIEITSEALDFFEKKKGFSPLALFTFIFQKAYCLFILSKYSESLEYYLKAKELSPTKGSTNWYNINSYLFNNYLVLNRIKDSYQLLTASLNHKNFENLLYQYRQTWLIKEAYFNFLIKAGKIDFDTSELRRFRLARFLNEVPHYTKDKRGLNISILIVQLLFYLVDKKYDDFIDRMDALKQYSYRYLRNNETFRSNCFIKMMLKIPDAYYNPIAVQRHVADLYERLVATPPEISDQSNHVEIIPYEVLWELILEVLDKDK